MATLFGSRNLGNITVSLDLLIESVEPGYEQPATPYVLLGLHAGSGTAGGSGPRSFYRQGPDADFLWLNAQGQWGCSLQGAGAGSVCASSHSLPAGFGGFNTWHSLSLGELPLPGGGAQITASLDGQQLFSFTQAAGQLKNGGAGGQVLLVTGCHRALFDNILIQESQGAAGRA